MASPTLSVIIPNYNHAHALPDCLAAVLSQTVPATEVIVIDDGSTDNSIAVLETFARQHPTIKLYRNDRNRGVLFTMNRGLDLAKGDYVFFLAADDLTMPGLFEKALGLLAQHPLAAFCGGITEFQDIGTGLNYYYGLNVADKPCYLTPAEMVQRSCEGRMLMFATPMILRRQAVLEAGKYYPELKWCTDWFTAWVAGYRHGVCYLPEVLGKFSKSSTSYSGKGMRDPKERYEIYRHILDHLDWPEYQDVSYLMRKGATLAQFGKEMLWLVLRNRQYRRYLTFPFLKQSLWWSFRVEMKKILPVFLARWYFKVAGYGQAPKPQAAKLL